MTRDLSAIVSATGQITGTKIRAEAKTSFSTHQPLFPPGRIIHLVRQHSERITDSNLEMFYHAILADTFDFNEVLVSPAMFRDHMPATVLFALEQVID